MNVRIRTIAFLFCLAGLFLWLRASYLLLLPQPRLEAFRQRQFERVVTLTPRRGDILDRHGNELATSVTAFSIFVDPSLVKRPVATAKALARILGLRYDEVLRKLKLREKKFVWIDRRVSRELRDQVARRKLRGVGAVEEPRRVYPNDQILSAVLGHVGLDGQGLAGLEGKFESVLRGDQKKISMQRDARGRPLVVDGQIFSEPPEGETLRLTIDREIQYKLEHELMQASLEHQADSAQGVVLDPKTGEVLGLASVPNFNPNFPGRSEPDHRRNRAITDPFEPGSTMKTFTIAAGLELGLFTPNSLVDCGGGVLKVGKRTIREADERHRYKWLTVNEILQHSSNVGSTKLAFNITSKKLRDKLFEFGFGQKTGIALPGESRGILPGLPWNDHLLANISFGHGIAATTLQVASAYAAIASGGVWRTPHLVTPPTESREGAFAFREARVMSESVAAQMTYMLLGATGFEGTGIKARVPGFQVAGKTGTSQRVSRDGKGYEPNSYISSFAGFLPAHDPRLVIYVVIDNPKRGYYGADVAAPVFSRVARFAVERLDLVPNLLAESDVKKGVFQVAAPAPRRNAAASKTIEKKISGPWMELERGQLSMPDLKGLTLSEVMEAVQARRLEASYFGKGVAIKTEPPSGTPVAEGGRVRIHFGPRESISSP